MRSQKRLVVIIAPAIVLGLLVLWSVNSKPEKTAVPSITQSTDKPSEVAPDKDTYKWTGAGDEPKYISLPTISAEGFVQKAGVDQNNQIAVPNNIHMAAWFNQSAKPGKPGLSVIDGHVNGRVNDGIFKNLVKLQDGSIYSVELGNGSVKKFRVFKVETVDLKEANNVLFSQDPKVSSQLNLITCGGSYDSKIHGYTKRVIVSSEYVN